MSPRKADPEAKTSQLVLVGKPSEKEKIKAVREICYRNNLQIHDVLMEGVDAFLRKHHWPPGNSQTLLEVFDIKAMVSTPICGIYGCSKPATDELFHELMKVYRCRKHKFFQLPWSTYGTKPIKR